MNFLYDYANHLYGDVDIELVKGYCEYVEKLLSEICCDDIDFFELINCLSNNINKLSLSIDENGTQCCMEIYGNCINYLHSIIKIQIWNMMKLEKKR